MAMRSRLMEEHPTRKWVLVFDEGDDPVQVMPAFAVDCLVPSCHFTGIGGFARAVLGYFDIQARKYRRIPVNEQAEVLMLAGNITDEGKRIHAHVVLGASDGHALGGHLLEASVRPTLELVVTEAPAHLRRRIDPATNLPLLVP